MVRISAYQQSTLNNQLLLSPLSDIHMEFYSFFLQSIRLKQSTVFGLSPIVGNDSDGIKPIG